VTEPVRQEGGLARALEEAKHFLQRLDDGGYHETFSPRAVGVFLAHVDVFVVELGTEAFRIARRHKSDLISAAHVDQAAANLVASSRRALARNMGVLGGILVGSGISQFLAMIGSPNLPPVPTAVATAMLVIGAALLVWDFTSR
jgi:hypothetical protein